MDNVNFSSSTGPNTFGTRLAEEFVSSKKIQLVNKNENCDIFLCFIEPTIAPKANSKLVQRLDGIWFKPDQFQSHNELIKWAYHKSSAVIWQSQFDKNMTTKWWGQKKGKVIGNGISLKDVEISDDVKALKDKFDKIFVCSASWHRQKRLKENTEFFLKNAGKNDGLIVMGKNPDFTVQDSRIFYPGNLSHNQCLEIYKASDWMIHLAWLDHCPNVVVEAISQDCPVICTESGGTSEIVKNNGIVIPEKNHYNYELCDYDSPPEIDIPKFDRFQKIKIKKEYLSIKKVSENYIKLFENLI